MKVKFWNLIAIIAVIVSVGQTRVSKNLDLTKSSLSDSLLGHGSDSNNYDTRENCNGPNMEWLTDGPQCDVFCDVQPAIQVQKKPSSLSSLLSHNNRNKRKLFNRNNRCQARMIDVIHDIINDAEEDPHKIFINGNLDLDRIAVNVTTTIRSWISDRLNNRNKDKNQDVVTYEGCYCLPGYARYGDNCVAIRDCPSKNAPAPSDCKAGNNEEWRDEGPECDLYCHTQPGDKNKGRSSINSLNRNRCEGRMLQEVQKYDPTVESLNDDIVEEVFARHGEEIRRNLKSSFSHNNNKGSNDYTVFSGCYCKEGYLRYGDVCLLPQNCPNTEGPVGNPNLCNGLNEEYRGTSNQCEVYCDIQPTKYGRWGNSVNSCGRTGDFLRNFLPTLDEFKSDLDRPAVLAKYAVNITEQLRLGNKNSVTDDGCYCQEGHARYGYRCVRLDQCPTRKCYKDEVYQTQGPVCEPTCSNLPYQQNGLVSCSTCETMSGCFCPTGFVRDDRGKCIDPINCWNYDTHYVPSHSTSGHVTYTYDDNDHKNSYDDDYNHNIHHDDDYRKDSDDDKTATEPEKVVNREEPIYNRRILDNSENGELNLNKPVVDAFKKDEDDVQTTEIPKTEEITTETVIPTTQKDTAEEISVPVFILQDTDQ